MEVYPIDPTNRRQIDRFIQFPFDLYRNCPQWVPPLINDFRKNFRRDLHPFYLHSDALFFLAENKGKVVGRIAGIHNANFNAYRKTNAVLFGYFDAVEDPEVARELVNAVAAWGRSRGAKEMYGPRALLTADGSGVLVEGFDHRAALNMPYNYPYYDKLLTGCGLIGYRDMLNGYLSREIGGLPDRIAQIAERMMQRRGFWVKTFTSKEEMRAWVPQVLEVYSTSFVTSPEYIPATPDEMAWAAEQLIQIAEPELIKLVMHENRIIGFLLAYHDISAGMQKARGRLFPFGWYHLMQDKKRTEWVNLNGVGILPEFQGMGANAILYLEIAKTLLGHQFNYGETIMVAEDNRNSYGDNLAGGVVWYKRYRRYHMPMGDPD